jgi:hypothetical protein
MALLFLTGIPKTLLRISLIFEQSVQIREICGKEFLALLIILAETGEPE